MSEIFVASWAFVAEAFALAVADVRLCPRGWLSRQFRKYLWLIPFNPMVIVRAAIGLLLRQVAEVVGIAAMSVRWLFEKATEPKASAG